MTRSDADLPVQHLPLHKTVGWKQHIQKVRGSDCLCASRLLSTNCLTGALRFLRKHPLMRLALKTVRFFRGRCRLLHRTRGAHQRRRGLA